MAAFLPSSFKLSDLDGFAAIFLSSSLLATTIYVLGLFDTLMAMTTIPRPSANEIEATFRVLPGLYLIGSMERG